MAHQPGEVVLKCDLDKKEIAPVDRALGLLQGGLVEIKFPGHQVVLQLCADCVRKLQESHGQYGEQGPGGTVRGARALDLHWAQPE